MSNTVNVYGCGGLGCNAVKSHIDFPQDMAGFAECKLGLIDTSESNINIVSKNDEHIKSQYLVPGLDGFGKSRTAKAVELIKPHISEFLVDLPPEDMNVVIFGTAGGTGSITGPLLIQELLARQKNVIGICVTSKDSGKEAENNLRTLQTLQNISMKAGVPLPMLIITDDGAATRTSQDDAIRQMVLAVSIMCSGKNERLDSKDIHNWINYHKVDSDLTPQLVTIMVIVGDEVPKNVENINAISTLALLTNVDERPLPLNQVYSATGILPKSFQDASNHDPKQRHFVITADLIPSYLQDLQATHEAYEKTKEVIKAAPKVSIKGGTEDDSGLIL